ncbi:hypothetical protein S40285_08886 [Stachybotrys chlorohalonatus IBT 40285]|uniref:Uncharacterized protein n=1 Tax=Stachybotrys chlorohalonatus (strain IBT 40285) TaxID=1283841 RepID=A0A084Q991_STAC4|nr:hypothetical protein S40285_08886 [Stachybotrys chlorohalonata IBT 40285]
MSRQFLSKLPSTKEPIKYPTGSTLDLLAKGSFKVPTIMLLGAVLQLALTAALPLRWAVIPAGVMLLNSVVSTLLQLRSPEANTYLEGVIPGRTTAQLPDAKGSMGPEPSAGSVVMFQLGVQFNHPLGFMAPSSAEVSAMFTRMNDELNAAREEHGFLGSSTWRAFDRDSNNTLLNTYFFKNVQSVNRFAQMETHTKAWQMYSALPDKAHIGIFHETYIIPANGYESLYVNCRPLLMGQGQVKCDTENGERWVSTLVSSNTPKLKTHYARLGRDHLGNIQE